MPAKSILGQKIVQIAEDQLRSEMKQAWSEKDQALIEVIGSRPDLEH